MLHVWPSFEYSAFGHVRTGRAKRATWFPLPRAQRHENTVFRAQCDDGRQFDGEAGHAVQLKALRDGGQDELAFHHGEVLADADARPAAEGKIGVARTIGILVRRETFGVELLRLRPEFGVAVREIR